MDPWFQTVTDLEGAADTVRRRRYGVIEMQAERWVGIHFRPWPKLLGIPEIIPVGERYHARGDADRCLLYYNQPRQFPNFLTLKYVVSTHGTRFATARGALLVLEAVAQIKGSDALLCDASNTRISDRLLRRWGWQAHKPQRWHRNFIKRFYGVYPAISLPNRRCEDAGDPVPVPASLGRELGL